MRRFPILVDTGQIATSVHGSGLRLVDVRGDSAHRERFARCLSRRIFRVRFSSMWTPTSPDPATGTTSASNCVAFAESMSRIGVAIPPPSSPMTIRAAPSRRASGFSCATSPRCRIGLDAVSSLDGRRTTGRIGSGQSSSARQVRRPCNTRGRRRPCRRGARAPRRARSSSMPCTRRYAGEADRSIPARAIFRARGTSPL